MSIDTQKDTQESEIITSRKEKQQKTALTKKTRLSFKQKKFAEEFVKNKGNGTQAILKSYNTTDINTAGAMAVENLSKPKIKLEIMSLLQQNGIEISEILSIHRRNLNQDQHLPTSQKAVSDFYEILGLKQHSEVDHSVKVAFVIEK